MDFDGKDIKSYLLENFKIINTMRIIKKSKKLNLIKGLITDEKMYNKILLDGHIQKGYTRVKTKAWNFDSQSDQCFKCLKFGHSFKTCTNEESCLRCAGKHNFKTCNIKNEKELLCLYCKGNHAACSKRMEDKEIKLK